MNKLQTFLLFTMTFIGYLLGLMIWLYTHANGVIIVALPVLSLLSSWFIVKKFNIWAYESNLNTNIIMFIGAGLVAWIIVSVVESTITRTANFETVISAVSLLIYVIAGEKILGVI